jgi:exo-beta-1,3-glucanase (GH17 family)
MNGPQGLNAASSFQRRALVICLTLSVTLFSLSASPSKAVALPSSTSTFTGQLRNASTLPLSGLAYGPYHLGQDPNFGVLLSAAEVAADIPTLSSLTGSIRIYSSLGPARDIVHGAERAHLSVDLGIWLGRDPDANKREMAAGIQLMSNPAVNTVTVGSEVLLRGDLSEQQLRAAIKEVRVSAGRVRHPVKVTTADVDGVWLAHPKLAKDVDVVTVHLYPFWQKVAIGNAIQVLDKSYAHVTRTFPGKKVVIGETGWPSDGPPQGSAMPSAENQSRYFKDFRAWTERQRPRVQYYYFDAFDEAWKSSEGGVGNHWGLYDQEGNIKPAFRDLLPAAAPETLRERAYRDIYVGGLSAGLGLGIDTSEHQHGWLTAERGTLTLAYPPNQAGGSMFITVGQPVPPGNRPAIDLSHYRSLVLDMRLAGPSAQPGCVHLGIKDTAQPDNGNETTVQECLYSSDWSTITVPLNTFAPADLTQLYVVFEVVFSGVVVGPIQLRTIRYSPN